MRREIFGSSPDPKTPGISERCKTSSSESRTLRAVYDIAHAGPRNRFTIATRSGHLVVHNSGYQGWIGAWVAFGADAFLSEEEIKKAILAWRAASPAVVYFWGGQEEGPRWARTPKMFGVEGMAISAVCNPGTEYPVMRLNGTFSGITYVARGDVLYCRLPSGRYLTYHRPRLQPSDRGGQAMSYEGYNSNPKNGPIGWIRMNTWGGRLTENINQAVCRDIMTHACVNLEAAGYPVVLHVYDEIVSEIPEDWGSAAEFEAIMERRPAWAHDWPIRAPGAWRAKRYRKG